MRKLAPILNENKDKWEDGDINWKKKLPENWRKRNDFELTALPIIS